jgi:hypothetical protein
LRTVRRPGPFERPGRSGTRGRRQEVLDVLRFKLGALFGFALGWAVGSGRASEFFEQLRARDNRVVGESGSGAWLDRTA